MKRSLVALVVVMGCATPTAQAPVVKAEPAAAAQTPSDPPPLVEGDVTEAHLGGMTVLVKRIKGAELVTSQLYVRGGALNWSTANAGIERLAIRVASSGGTTALDKPAFGRKLASLGAEVSAETTRDWSKLQIKGPVQAQDTMLALLADVFLRPSLPQSEVEVARQQQLVRIRQQDEDPDSRLERFLDDVRFKNHPYAVSPDGTPESVAALTQPQLVAHLASLRQSSRLVLVVVGDVDAAKQLSTASALFGGLPRGTEPAKMPAAASITTAALASEARKLPTNYLKGVFTGPPPSSPHYAAAVATQRLLWERLFFEVRTKRNLSYAPSPVWELTGAGTYGGLYVTAVDPNTTWKVMYDELRRLQREPVKAEELAGAKSQARTGMFMRQETTDGQASTLGADLLLTGDWRFRPKLNLQVQAVTAEAIQAYATQYMGKLQVVLLGDPAKLDPALATSL